MIPAGPRANAAALAIVAAVGFGWAGGTGPAAAKDVDVQLLLATDFSPSIDANEYTLQIRGLARALRSPAVVAAVSAAPNGVAVALMQWAGPKEQVLSVPWSVIRDRLTIDAFAAKVEAVMRPATDGGTAIGDALARGVALMGASGVRAARRIIDISGDGKANIGDSPGPERVRAVSLGITINGLVILDEEPHLAGYFESRVIGGIGAFVLNVHDFEDFAKAMELKLLRELEIAMTASADARHEIGGAVIAAR